MPYTHYGLAVSRKEDPSRYYRELRSILFNSINVVTEYISDDVFLTGIFAFVGHVTANNVNGQPLTRRPFRYFGFWAVAMFAKRLFSLFSIFNFSQFFFNPRTSQRTPPLRGKTTI